MFDFNFDKKAIMLIFAIMLIVWLLSLKAQTMLSILFAVPGVLVAMTFHEFAHAFAADKLRR